MKCFMIAVVTADGFIARHQGHNSTTWTSKEDTKFFRQRTKEAGVVVMGKPTYDTVGRPMPKRLNIIYSRQVAPTPLEQFPTPDAVPEEGVVVYSQAEPAELLRHLEKLGYSELAVCGGSSIYSLFAPVCDTLYLTIEPLFFGQGITLFKESLEQKLELVKTEALSSQTLLLEYRFIRS